ncbi:MAG: hypothetical protein QNJ54_26565 [Prochloraceae cyanobacterium]|nr:hypothetical protein [Prochloraceae cyanobacterium]
MDKKQHIVLEILMIRFGLNSNLALPLVQKWLQTHPTSSLDKLRKLLLTGKVSLKNGTLYDVNPKEMNVLTNKMLAENGLFFY